MRVEVLNTGDELLLGETINTHVAYLGRELLKVGLRIASQTTVPDGQAVWDAVAEMVPRCDVLLVTGGLGPTSDDMTRDAVAGELGLLMTEDPQIVAAIAERLSRSGHRMVETNRKQALVPEGGEVMANPNGTAPGLYIPANLSRKTGRSPHVFLMPGPPRELHPMVESEVLPRLVKLDGASAKVTSDFKIHGLGESRIAGALERWVGEREGMEVGYREVVDKAAQTVRRLFSTMILSEDKTEMEEVVVSQLIQAGKWVSTVESCTGGLLASRITDISGASSIFGRGFVTYSNQAKVEEVGVPAELIAEHGAVSRPVAAAMAEGGLRVSEADYALSLTGVAGPTGGTDEKPVGTVFIGLATKGEETVVGRYSYPRGRELFKRHATTQALELLRRRLVGLPIRTPL
jgi:nicotinamide-nucleotide amidase